jgi:hypothetical protein
MARSLRSCEICRSLEGDLVGDVKIALLDTGICNGCRESLDKLEQWYRTDFEGRTDQKFQQVIPWPAVKQFTWPPYSDVIVSGIAVDLREFAIGIGDEFLVSGKRSYESHRAEVTARIAELDKLIPTCDKADQKMIMEKEQDMAHRRLDAIEKRRRVTGERKLFTIGIEHMDGLKVKPQGHYLEVTFRFETVKDKFLTGGRKAVTESHRWLIHQEYAAAVDYIQKRQEAVGH